MIIGMLNLIHYIVVVIADSNNELWNEWYNRFIMYQNTANYKPKSRMEKIIEQATTCIALKSRTVFVLVYLY